MIKTVNMEKNKDFILSDESVNSYGFVVKTSGIVLEKFLSNPVMYYNHERSRGVIGRWENVRVEGGKLLATPVFDEEDELGKKIANKVAKGFLRAASIGIEVLTVDASGTTATTSELVESSICDLPSNKNALRLFKDGKELKFKEKQLNLKLILTTNTMKDDDLKRIAVACGLPSDATVDDVLTSINGLNAGTAASLIENAISLKVVGDFEKSALLALANTDFDSFKTYIETRKSERLKDIREKSTKLISEAAKDGRLMYPGSSVVGKQFWMKALEMDFETGKMVLEHLNKRFIFSDHLSNSSRSHSGEDRSAWTLNDYRKKAPRELASNPDLYQRLLEEDKHNKKTK